MNIVDAHWLVAATARLRGVLGSGHVRFGQPGRGTNVEAALAPGDLRRDTNPARRFTVADVATVSLNWSVLQRRFVDDPRGTIVAADLLVREILQQRGYVTDVEPIAPETPASPQPILDAYLRLRRDVSASGGAASLDTEQQRQMVLRYRTLVNELLEISAAEERHSSQEQPQAQLVVQA